MYRYAVLGTTEINTSFSDGSYRFHDRYDGITVRLEEVKLDNSFLRVNNNLPHYIDDYNSPIR